MSDNQIVKPNALVVMVNDNPLSVSKAIKKIISRFESNISIGSSGDSFTYLGSRNFSRSPIELTHPEKIKIDEIEYYKYPIYFSSVTVKKKTYNIIGCRYSGALKEFILKNLEAQMQQFHESFAFLEVNLFEIKKALENGDNLKGRVKALASRIDYFGDNGLEKIVLRGEDVFLSEKYNAIWDVLSGGVSESLALHSIVLQFESEYRDIKTTIDRFGNFRVSIGPESEKLNYSEFIRFLTKYSIEKKVCPLRRITKDEDDE